MSLSLSLSRSHAPPAAAARGPPHSCQCNHDCASESLRVRLQSCARLSKLVFGLWRVYFPPVLRLFGLWRVCFPPCLVRPGRRLPVQGLSEGSLDNLSSRHSVSVSLSRNSKFPINDVKITLSSRHSVTQCRCQEIPNSQSTLQK